MSAQPQARPVANAFSVDVEDYFHVSAFSGRIDREDWEKWPCRVEASTGFAPPTPPSACPPELVTIAAALRPDYRRLQALRIRPDDPPS